jgi:hypothetical protein
MPKLSSVKRPRDPSQLADAIVRKSSELDAVQAPALSVKNQAAVELGRLGGLKVGAARAKKLSAKKRSAIAKKAAAARWASP